jgi:hypothetical protein
MSLEKGSNSEKKEVPKTVDETIVKYLAFQDAIHPDQKAEQLKQTYEFPKIKEYAHALMDLAQREGMENVENLADSMVGSLQEEAKKLKLQLSRYGEDRSWAMFGLAQEYYNFKNPENFPETERPFLVDPMEISPLAQDKQRDLVHRELAREARREYRQNPEKQNSWTKFVDEVEAFELAYEGLRKEPENPGERIQSDELVELGTVLSRIGTNLEHQSHEYATPSISSEVAPASSGPEPQKSEASPKEPEKVKSEEKTNDTTSEPQSQENRKTNTDGIQPEKKGGTSQEKKEKAKNTKISAGDVVKAGSYIGFLFPLIGVALAAKEFYKTAKESVVGMFGVLKKTLAKGFAGLNAGVGAAPAKPAAHKKEDHGEKHDAPAKHDARH